MLETDTLFDAGTTAITATGYGAGSALNTGPGEYTIEVTMTTFNNTAGTDVITVEESADGVTYNTLATFETFSDVGQKYRKVKTDKNYLKLKHTLTTVTSLTCVAGIVAAHGGAV